MVDERGSIPLVILDEAQHLSDSFLLDLGGFLNFAFDSRDLLTLWLVGLPPLTRRLHMQQHAARRSRIAVRRRRRARLQGRRRVAEGPRRPGHGDAVPRQPRRPAHRSRTLRTAMRIAAERGQTFLDEATVAAALDELGAGA